MKSLAIRENVAEPILPVTRGRKTSIILYRSFFFVLETCIFAANDVK